MLIPDPAAHFGPWQIDDDVVGPLEYALLTADGEDVDLTGFDVAPGSVAIRPDGDEEPIDVDLAGSLLQVTFDLGVWAIPGIWRAAPRLSDGANTFEPEPFRFVVEDRGDGWLTLGEIRAAWRDAPRSDVSLYNLLDVSRRQVEAWAQIGDEDVIATSSLTMAQGLQAREIWNESKRDPNTLGIGEGEFLVRPIPLSPVIKDLIRNKRPKPVVA